MYALSIINMLVRKKHIYYSRIIKKKTIVRKIYTLALFST